MSNLINEKYEAVWLCRDVFSAIFTVFVGAHETILSGPIRKRLLIYCVYCKQVSPIPLQWFDSLWNLIYIILQLDN